MPNHSGDVPLETFENNVTADVPVEVPGPLGVVCFFFFSNDHREVVHFRKAIILVQPSSDATWQTTSFEEMSETESTIVPEDTSKFSKHADLLIVCLQYH